MNNDKTIYNYLQVVLGYSLTGWTNMRSLFILWGKGSNGKSTLCNLLKNIMKKYYIIADKRIFMDTDNKNNSHTSHLIPLVTARIAVLSETQENERLNENLIKSLTGEDAMTARELYGKQFTFTPKAKYILLTNNKPTFKLEQSMLDRIKYIPFNARFVDFPKDGEFKRDPNIIETLNKNLDIVFTWLCIGAKKYFDNGMKIETPQILKDHLTDYINDIDGATKFIEGKIRMNLLNKTKRAVIYESYKNFCNNSNITNGTNYIILSCNEFYCKLNEKGYNEYISSGNKIYKIDILNDYLE